MTFKADWLPMCSTHMIVAKNIQMVLNNLICSGMQLMKVLISKILIGTRKSKQSKTSIQNQRVEHLQEIKSTYCLLYK